MDRAVSNLLKRHFEFVDRDGNGVIELDEFKELLAQMGFKRSAGVVELAFRDIDTDGNGTIDFAEFANWWRKGGDDSLDPRMDTGPA